jgi:molybdopterin-guanine dinucleotide biosynthesis protein A
MTTIVAAVLSGGRSRRMGRDKASIQVGGRPFSEWIRRALAGRTTVFLGGDLPDVRTIGDAPGSGPVAGLASALTIGADAVLLVAVDQPWLRPGTVDHLVERFSGRPVVPVDDGVRQVTCAIYPASLAPKAARLAEEGRALQAVLDDVGVDEVPAAEWAEWGEDGRSWFGADTPDEVAEGIERFGLPGGAA